ncbi:MAG: DUF1232 domain-containing protein [Treponema sp.]|nr:DUF1232 domain-containing protein [Treponema sp.]
MPEQKKVEESELQNYTKHFDQNLAHELLKKLRKTTRDKPKIVAGAAGAIVVVLGKLLSAFENPETPLPMKALVVGAIGYIILPVDLIPDLMPVVGYTDDLASAGGVVATVARYCNFTLSELDKEIDEEDSGNAEVLLDDKLPEDDELDEAFMSDDDDLGILAEDGEDETDDE